MLAYRNQEVRTFSKRKYKGMTSTIDNRALLEQFANLSPAQRVQILAKLEAQGVKVARNDGAPLESGSPHGMDSNGVDNDVPSTTIPKIDRSAPIPLSYPQEQLWFLHELAPESGAYNERIAVRMAGKLKVDLLEEAIQFVVSRHESLRTTFQKVEKHRDERAARGIESSHTYHAVQVIQPFDADSYRVIRHPLSALDLRSPDGVTDAHASLDSTTALAKAIDAYTLQPFDLGRVPLCRFILFSGHEGFSGQDDFSGQDGAGSSFANGSAPLAPADKHVLLFVVHHIIADAWSIAIILEEIAACYSALRQGQAPARPEPSVTYADFAAWQRQRLSGERLDQQLAFWQQSLAGGRPLSASAR